MDKAVTIISLVLLSNNLVMFWLINSMTPEIGENFLLYATAKDIWNAA